MGYPCYMAGGNPGPIWVRGPFLLASGLFLLHGANGGTRGKRQPPACPGPGRQAQSRNSALTQMTQGISGSGARRWSVRKPCLAVPVRFRRAPLGDSRTGGLGKTEEHPIICHGFAIKPSPSGEGFGHVPGYPLLKGRALRASLGPVPARYAPFEQDA